MDPGSGTTGKVAGGTGSVLYEVHRAAAPLRTQPGADAALDTELLRGERIRIHEFHQGWGWGQAETDGYEGYVPKDALQKAAARPTCRVKTLATRLYRRPEAVAGSETVAWFGSRIALGDARAEGFLETADGLWVPTDHVAPLETPEADYIAAARRFEGVPYLFGGRTPAGLDCSALVQLVLQAAGMACPRNTGPQRETLGRPVAGNAAPRRGDLAFWKGHVGLFVDPATLLHANAHHMAVALEPFAEAVRRIGAAGLPLLGIHRLPEDLRSSVQ